MTTSKWHSVPKVRTKYKRRTKKLTRSAAFRRPERGHSVNWWHNILTNNLSEYNKPSGGLLYCPIVPLSHWRFCLYRQSKLWHDAKAKFNKSYFRMQISATQVCSLFDGFVWTKGKFRLSREINRIYIYSSGNKYTMEIIFFTTKLLI